MLFICLSMVFPDKFFEFRFEWPPSGVRINRATHPSTIPVRNCFEYCRLTRLYVVFNRAQFNFVYRNAENKRELCIQLTFTKKMVYVLCVTLLIK